MTGMAGALLFGKLWVSTDQDVLVNKTGDVPKRGPLVQARNPFLVPLIHPHIIILMLVVDPEIMLDSLVPCFVPEIVKLAA
jgi:hypothetical protein